MDELQFNGVCDENIFSRIFSSHVKALRNYLYYKYGNEQQAYDVTQDAFIKLWQNCSKVAPEKAKSYLYTVANNSSINLIAHRMVMLEYAATSKQTGTDPDRPDLLLEEKEFMQKLQRSIDWLSDAQRTAFLMNRIDGKKYTEIAEILDISVKAVEKRISGALASLRKDIEAFK